VRTIVIAVDPAAGVGAGLRARTNLAEITAIDPTAAGRAADEVLCVALGLIAHSSPEDGAAGNVWHSRTTTTVGGVLLGY
jgi:hypothetical protein